MTRSDGYNLWLSYENPGTPDAKQYAALVRTIIVLGNTSILDSAAQELERALPLLCGSSYAGTIRRNTKNVPVPDIMAGPYQLLPAAARAETGIIPEGDGFRIISAADPGVPRIIITSGTDRGVLYGTFAFLRILQQGRPIDTLSITDSPKIRWRMLDHWDNPDGSIERGYAGTSLWKWNELPETVSPRYTDYARACASIGLNGSVLNNVNAVPEILTPAYLEKVQTIAGVLRRYGITVFLSINFASPVLLGSLPTADPLDTRVRRWWKDKADEIYRYIPDFGGFLVKADCEGQTGPYAYGRTHADGANMLAEALAPHRGIVIWRAFVYGQGETDRAKKAYADFKPLDGKFADTVAVQVKNGPIDFQPREPVHPLFGGMEQTTLFMELQATQEYLGQEKHIVYLAPMWKEILDFDVNGGTGEKLTAGNIVSSGKNAGNGSFSGIAAVANTGSDSTWCGSLLHPANWYAFGRLAWDYTLGSEAVAREWIACTWGRDPEITRQLLFILMHSWAACVDYMTPLGLHHIMKFAHHYGPDPACGEGTREDWKPRYYHRADTAGLGFDRSRTGSGAVDQYRRPAADIFDTIQTCPEKYLLWFHHVPWSYVLKSGRTLKQELIFRYERGVQEAERLEAAWKKLSCKVPGILSREAYDAVAEKLSGQTESAREWRDVCIPYFMKFAEEKTT
jgi:alpha-glucuronidase